MSHGTLEALFLDQSNDLIWMVDADLLLTYANQAYLNVMKQVTGNEKKLNESVLVEGFGEGYIKKWTGYYRRALSGEQFELEEHYAHPQTNEIQFGQIIFNPIRDKNNLVVAVACQSRDITRIVKQRSEAHQLMDASLDVFCTVNEAGNFVFVSEAATKHWGYTPQELIGKPYVSLIVEEDIPKTSDIANAILNGEEIKSFVNRYKRKDGGVAYNLWSASWDNEAKLIYGVARDVKEKIEQENLLQQSEQRFKALVQEGADMISIIDVEGRYIYTSPTTIGILGITPEEFQGRTVFDFIHPDDVERAAGYMQQISAESKVIVEPFRLRNGNNEWRWIETVLTNMIDNPAVGGIVANSRDITESVNMLKNVKANEQFNRTIIESSPDCLKILDKEGQLLYMNFNGLCQMEIDNFSEFKNKKWWLMWGQENEALVKESVDKALKGDTVSFTAFCPTVKGTPKWWDVTVSPVSVPGEPIQQIISISRDITAKKAEEQRLKLLESVITNTNDAVLITEAEPLDEPGPRIVYVNDAFTRMTGYTAEEVIGKSPRILQGPNSDKAELARMSKALRNWETCEITTINYKKNGDEFWINFSVSPVADETGWYTHWIAIERDVTEQKVKQREKELLTDISLNFNRDNDFGNACKELCQTIGVFGGFDWVELSTINMERSNLKYTSHYLQDISHEVFYAETQGYQSFDKGSGLPGQVWQKKNQVFWNSLDDSKDFIRKEAAKKINLKAVLGIPLINQNEVIGVLLVGSKHGVEYLDKYAELFANFQTFIGSEINRKKLENDLSHLYESIPEIVCVTDFKGRFLKMNPSGCHLLGYIEEEILYQSLEEFVFAADKEITAQEIAKLSKGQSVSSFENRYVQKSGELCWLSWTANSNMQETLIYATARNITIEKKLRELNTTTSKMARIGSWEVDLIKNKILWTEMVHKLHETDPKTFEPDLSKGINFYREDCRPMVTEAVNQCIQLGTPFDFEAAIVTATGKDLWIRAIGQAEFSDGKCIRIYGSFQDIDELKTAEHHKNSLLTTLQKSLNEIYVFDAETLKFSYVNQGALLNIGYSETEIKELTPLDLKPAFTATTFNQLVNPLVTKEKEKIIFNTNHKRKNGTLYPVEVHLQFVNEGNNKKFLAVILDITDLKKTEQLLDSASKLARVGSWELVVQDNGELKMFWSGMTKNILEIDESFEPTLAYGLSLHKEPSRSLVEAAMNKLMQSGEAFDLELELLTAKGNDIWVRCIGDAQLENGKVNRIYGSFQDIHERKVNEIALRESLKTLEDYKFSLDQSAIVAYTDSKGVISFVNDNFCKISQYSKEELIGKTHQIINSRHHPKEFFVDLWKTISSGNVWRGEIKNAAKDGSYYWVDTTIVPFLDKNKKPLQYLAIRFDVTDRKIAEDVILKTLAEKNNILESIGDAFFAIDKNWVVTYWNNIAEKSFQKNKNDIVGKNLWEVYPKAIGSDYYINYHHAMETMETQSFETFAEDRNEWLEVTAYPSEDGLSIYFTDITQRKKENEAIAKSEEKRRLIMNGALDAIITIDTNETISFWNPKAEVVFGWKAEEVMGKPLSEVIIPEAFRKYHVEGLKNYLKTGEGKALNVLLQLSALRKNGDEFPIELTVIPIKQGGEEFFCAFIRDITDRKKAETELLSAFNEKNSILERITEAFVSLDANWCYTYMNKQAGEIFDRDPEKMIGKHIWTEFPEGMNQPFHLAYEKAMATQEYIHVEEHYKPYDLWFENHIYPSPDGISIFFRNVTERKKAESEIKQANERFEKVTEATNDVIWDWDMESGTFFRSNAIDNFFGVETSRILANKDFWRDNIHREDISKIESSMQKALEDPDCNRWEEEYRILNDNNEIFFVIDRGLILRDKNGKAIRMVGAMTNITEQKKQAEKLIELNQSLYEQASELKRSNEELEQFAFVTSHDLQEPLRMITSFMDQLKRKYADRLDEKGLQYIHFATDGAKRMKQIILDLLLYSRANKPTEQNERINLHEIVSEYTELRRKVIDEKKATITFHGLPSIETYRAPITQIFHCLLDNALKYVDQNKSPRIEISTIEKENVWQFAIKDNGVGIDPKFYDKIFIIFQRLQNRKEQDGTGIGLAVAKRSIEFLGGEIWVESEIDKGSTFYFTIFKIKQLI